MTTAIITGAGGLVGAEACRFFHRVGFDIVGIDNDMRKQFFGNEASTRWQIAELQRELGRSYHHHSADIRNSDEMEAIFKRYGSSCKLIIHAAAQPSHDWAARAPLTDFNINALGTIIILEKFRNHCSDAVFIFTSTNKVYGDTPNMLPLKEKQTRWELDKDHVYYKGIDEQMSIDHSTHSIFGASKVSADIMVQEYGRYFGLRTGCFRGGCLTGPGHSGAELHGFLAYLMKCAVIGRPYTIFGYKGKQVRDNITSHDLISCFYEFYKSPKPGEVYNIGGGRASNCSILEAIEICQEITGNKMDISYADTNRTGDHIWWISDLAKLRKDLPNWKPSSEITSILDTINQENIVRWQKDALQ